jgi:hypothetical protein
VGLGAGDGDTDSVFRALLHPAATTSTPRIDTTRIMISGSAADVAARGELLEHATMQYRSFQGNKETRS